MRYHIINYILPLTAVRRWSEQAVDWDNYYWNHVHCRGTIAVRLTNGASRTFHEQISKCSSYASKCKMASHTERSFWTESKTGHQQAEQSLNQLFIYINLISPGCWNRGPFWTGHHERYLFASLLFHSMSRRKEVWLRADKEYCIYQHVGNVVPTITYTVTWADMEAFHG